MVSDRHSSPRPAGNELDPKVKVKLDRLAADVLSSKQEFDDVQEQLKTLKPSDALEALDKLDSALRTSTVRNTSAYLSGVIRRITQHPSSQGGASTVLPSLFPEAQAVLDYLYQLGAVRKGEIDSKQLGILSKKPPEYQVLIMDTFRDRNLRGIRNMAAFFSSHQTQVEKDLRDNKLRLPRLGGPPPSRDNRYPPPHSRSDDRGGGGGDRGPPYSEYPPPHQQQHHHHHHQEYPPRPQEYQQQQGGYPNGPPPSSQYHHPQHPSYQPGSPGQGGSGPGSMMHPHGAPPGPTAPGPGPNPYSGQIPPTGPPSLSMGMGMGMGMPPPSTPAPPKHYAIEQGQWGIRADEFQNLSPFAKYVHPATALRLQQLWDVEQNKLVSVLNEASWESIAGLDAVNGVAAVNECAEAMKSVGDDLITINGIFLRIALKYPKRQDAPTLATIALAAADAAIGNALPSLVSSLVGGVQPQYQQQQQREPEPYVPGPAPGSIAGPYGAPPPHHGQQQQGPSHYQQPSGGPPPYGQAPGHHLPPPGAAQAAAPPPPSVQLPGQAGSLPPLVQAEIDSILRRWGGLLKLEHFEGRPIETMLDIGERNSMLALEDFGRNDPTSMRSPTAYLIGCLKKFGGKRVGETTGRDRERGGGGRGDVRGRGRGRGGGGGRYGSSRGYQPY